MAQPNPEIEKNGPADSLDAVVTTPGAQAPSDAGSAEEEKVSVSALIAVFVSASNFTIYQGSVHCGFDKS